MLESAIFLLQACICLVLLLLTQRGTGERNRLQLEVNNNPLNYHQDILIILSLEAAWSGLEPDMHRLCWDILARIGFCTLSMVSPLNIEALSLLV